MSARAGPIAVAALVAALGIAAPARAAEPQAAIEPAAMLRLAAQHGCTTCHDVEPPRSGAVRLPPLGPSWSEVAQRYRDDPGAEDFLVRAVVKGTAARHWKERSGFEGMTAQGDWIDPADAQALVRWILSR